MKLVPFHQPFVGLTLSVEVTRANDRLQLVYRIPGPLLPASLPVPAPRNRRNELWKGDCMELFIGGTDSTYWEYNFSLDGHWNCYRFDDYRQGVREEACKLLRFSGRQDGMVEYHIEVDTPPGLPQNATCNPTVILRGTGEPHFFAATHTTPEPDFHQANCRIVVVNDSL